MEFCWFISKVDLTPVSVFCVSNVNPTYTRKVSPLWLAGENRSFRSFQDNACLSDLPIACKELMQHAPNILPFDSTYAPNRTSRTDSSDDHECESPATNFFWRSVSFNCAGLAPDLSGHGSAATMVVKAVTRSAQKARRIHTINLAASLCNSPKFQISCFHGLSPMVTRYVFRLLQYVFDTRRAASDQLSFIRFKVDIATECAT